MKSSEGRVSLERSQLESYKVTFFDAQYEHRGHYSMGEGWVGGKVVRDHA